ncbi:MAG: NAD(P)/FAD-dependent oxidoreductase [Halodesulfurarchaeum sp.]
MSRAGVEVLVVGGGVIGAAVAAELAPDRDVLLLEREHVGAGASALAAGEVTMTPSYSDYPRIAEHANRFFAALSGTGSFEYHPRPSLELVPPERADAARRRADRLAGEGIAVSFLEPAAVENRHPRFDLSGYAGAISHEETGFLDPYTLTVTLADMAEERGATVETGRGATGLLVDNGDVVGVTTERGPIPAETVVVALGWRTERFLREYVSLPVRPYRTQIVVLEPPDPLPEDFPMGWIPGRHVYFKPEPNGDLLVGGFSAAVEEPATASDQVDEAFRNHVAELVPSTIPGMDGAGFVDGWAGIDGATPDTRPIIDAPDVAPDGLVVATGFHGRGVMTAPVAATVVGDLVRDVEPTLPHEPFRLSRFESRSREFPFTSISAGTDDYDEP